MEELDLIKQKLELSCKETEVLAKSSGLEFERIARAIGQMGNLLDLLYLEVSVLVELLGQKKVIEEKEFADMLEATAKKVEENIKKQGQEAKEEVKPEKL